jgi:hypothetical protein
LASNRPPSASFRVSGRDESWTQAKRFLPLNYIKRLTATGKHRPVVRYFHRLCVDDGFKTAVAFPTAPKMTILMLTPILGPFGGDQLIVALNAGHPESGTKIGFCHRWNLNVFDSARIWKEVTDLWQ